MSPEQLQERNIYQEIKPVLDQLDIELLRLREKPLVVDHKEGVGSQAALVTAADRFADEYLRKELKKLFPEFGFVTEEGDHQATEEYVWIIDPIDGTNNYAHGLDMFGVSIGLWQQDGTSIFGIIDLPARNTRIWGGKGQGVWHDGKRLSTPSQLAPEKAMLTIAPIWSNPTQGGAVTQALAEKVGHTRDHGSNVWQSFLVLVGQANANLSFRLSIWDIAAAVALAEELGLSVLFSNNTQRHDLIKLADQPVTVAIGQQTLAGQLVSAVEPWIS
jgi:myo-inositol-1(or 4)-monophosphatase